MPKGFKNKPCVYCLSGSSTSKGDHILPRAFFLEEERDNIPKVPACKICNGKKSRLEHYLATVLPFGGKHQSARKNLKEQVPKRLERNARLHQALQAEKTKVMEKSTTGLSVSQLRLPFDGEKYIIFFEYVGKALLWHHWKLYVPDSHKITSLVLSSYGEFFFGNLLNLNAKREVEDTIGDDVFRYRGKLSNCDPLICVWEFSLYGGIDVAGLTEISNLFGVLIAPSGIIKSLNIV